MAVADHISLSQILPDPMPMLDFDAAISTGFSPSHCPFSVHDYEGGLERERERTEFAHVEDIFEFEETGRCSGASPTRFPYGHEPQTESPANFAEARRRTARSRVARHRSQLAAASNKNVKNHKRQTKRNFYRPKHNHSKVAVDVLKEWFMANINSPFPCNEVKNKLAESSGLDLKQVSTWLINERKRILKPLRIAAGRPPLRNRLGKDFAHPGWCCESASFAGY